VRRRLAALLALALVAACSSGGDDDPAPEAEAVVPACAEDAVEAHADDWPTPGQDLDNSRTAAGSSIEAANVEQLEVAWTAELEGAGSLSTTPLVLGDTVFLQTGSGQAVALDRETGEERWKSEPSGFNIGPFGVAVGGGRVYALDGSTGVRALDCETGEELWSTDITATDTTGVDIQPVAVGDLVIASSVPVSLEGIYAAGDRGVITALDAATGEVRWEFDTVQGDLWGHPEVNSGGGIWYPPAVDEEAGVVYAGVANPAPFPGTKEFPNASSRPGDNLYTNSLVALDLETGELLWHHQVIPHDLLDRDQVHALVARPDGGDPVVVSAGKSGVVVGLTPDGEPLWRTEVGRHENDDLTELPPEGIAVYPGTYGGVLTPPSTADGVVYLAVLNAPSTLKPDETAYFGGTLGTNDGEVVAVDASDGRILWSTEVPGDPLGATAVVNDLVLTTLLDGTVLALDREDGEVLWRHEAGGTVNGWLAVAGDDVVVPVGGADPPAVVALRLRR
jgi:glucose dehydrogenase